MGVMTEVFEAALSLAQAVPGLYASVTVGPMPANNGISMAEAGGAPKHTDFLKGMAFRCRIVLNGKHSDQRKVTDALSTIHAALTQRKDYPAGNRWQITDISTIATPNYLGRENNDQWLYGSSLLVKYYARS